MKIPYPANIYTIKALREAIKELESTIKTCGGLATEDTKINDRAKAYFKRQGEEAEVIINQLDKIIKGINP